MCACNKHTMQKHVRHKIASVSLNTCSSRPKAAAGISLRGLGRPSVVDDVVLDVLGQALKAKNS